MSSLETKEKLQNALEPERPIIKKTWTPSSQKRHQPYGKGAPKESKNWKGFPQTVCECQHHFGETGLLQKEEVVHQTIKVPFLPLSTDSSCTLGCIHAPYANWAQLTSDRFILNIIQHGITIDFINTVPSCSKPRPLCHLSIVQQEALTGEINHLLSCGVLSEASYSSDKYVSSIFGTEKPDLSICLILNLKRFNVFAHHIHFKMESLPGCALFNSARGVDGVC